MIYKPKTTFPGYKIGLGNANLYIGIPDKYFKHNCMVKIEGEIKTYSDSDVVLEKEFDDKFSAGTYKLRYVLYKLAERE
jgi:hypothetical protein